MGTGLLLLSTAWLSEGRGQIKLWYSLLIGLAQAFAILPGVSRSGATIVCARFLGVEMEEAARFSFLLSLPVILGASLLKLWDLIQTPPDAQLLFALSIGVLTATLGGVLALKSLFLLIRKGWFAHFGWYCLALGAVALFY